MTREVQATMSATRTLSRVGRFAFRPGAWLGGAVRRRPRLSTALALVVLLGLAAGGAHLWALSEERAARRAIAEDHYDEAARHVDHCLWVWPRSASTHLLAARVARLRSDFRGAEAELRESGRLAGGPSEATQLEWLLLRAQGGEADVVAPGLLRLVKEHHPDSVAILQTLTDVYLREQRLGPAQQCLNAWVEIEPDSPAALERGGWVLEQKEMFDAARAEWESALRHDPERWSARLRLAERLLEENKSGAARPHVEYLMRDHADRPEVLAALGRCRLEEGDVPKAREALDRALALAPDAPGALLWRGRVAMEEGQYAEAERFLRRSLEKDPANLKTNYALTQALERLEGRGAEAEAQRTRYLTLKADAEQLSRLLTADRKESPDAATCAEIGRLMMRLDREGPGLRWLQIALAEDPNCRAAHEELAAYYERHGDADRAAAERRATSKAP
jgi:tetratricopeptide (TPR) repeat protein